MIQFHVYPGGLKRIVTFSFDDGSQNDVRLISLFDKYGLKATFHLNGKFIRIMKSPVIRFHTAGRQECLTLLSLRK